jgi:predicted DNA-binding antitoxin AbrB/MazE fold protein
MKLTMGYNLVNGRTHQEGVVMVVSIRAVYENGTLRPLTPIELEEGQEVQIEIVPTEGPIYTALGDLVVIPAPGDLPDLDEDTL